jgi:hypothetical protein
MLGERSPRDHRSDTVHVDDVLGIEGRLVVGGQPPPRLDSPLEQPAARRHRTACEVLVGHVVRRDETDLRPHLDRHVAERQPALDRQRSDGGSRPLDGVPPAGGDPELRDRREHEVLRGGGGVGRPVEPNPHRARAALSDRLCGEHMGRFARADPPRDGAEAAVRAGVTVRAHEEHPGLRDAELGADDVDDALTVVVEVEHPDPGRCAPPAHVAEQHPAGGIGVGGAARRRRDRMIGRREREVGPPHRDAGALDPEQVGSGFQVVDQVPIHVEQ